MASKRAKSDVHEATSPEVAAAEAECHRLAAEDPGNRKARLAARAKLDEIVAADAARRLAANLDPATLAALKKVS